MCSMYCTIVHTVEGDRVSTWRLEAPGFVPALRVFATFVEHLEAGSGTMADYRIRNFDRVAPTEEDLWFAWCARSPVTVIEGPGLPPMQALPEVDSTWSAILAGPDSGFCIPWSQHVTVGRSNKATLQVFDPHMSRAPTHIDSSTTPTVHGATHITHVDPRNRDSPPAPVSWPSAQTVSPPRPPHFAHYVIPIVLGVVLMLVTHMWWFLLFSIGGPISAGLSLVIDKRRYARELREAIRDFSLSLHQFEASVVAARAQGVAVENQRAFSLSRVPVGVGRCCVPATVKVPPSYDPPFDRLASRIELDGIERTSHTDLWADRLPVTVDLTCTELVLRGDSAPEVARAILVMVRACGAGIYFHDTPHLPEFAGVGCATSASPTVTVRWGETIRLTPENVTDTWILDCPDVLTGTLHCPTPPGNGPLPGPVALRAMPAHRFLHVLGPTPDRTMSVAELHPISVDELTCAVAAHGAGPPSATAVPVGVNECGAVYLDLFTDGPHALVAGTTGSGKSVFLSSWIRSLAHRFTAKHVRFVLVDFKGGAAFTPFAHLPHTDSVVSNLDTVLGLRALTCVLAEVKRREELFARAHVSDIDAYNASHEPLPRIVTVIDEFQALVHEVPESVDILEQLTALGRSLGVHAVLATQRPSGVVTARMKSNISLRVSLRVRDAQDSRDVIDADDAAHLDPGVAGLGFISTGEAPTLFRSAHTGTPDPAVIRWAAYPLNETTPPSSVDVTGVEPPRPPSMDTPRNTHSIVPPPLPLEFDDTATALFDTQTGLTPWSYSPDTDGSVLISGGPGRGKTHALHVVAGHASSSHLVVGFGRPATSFPSAHVYATDEWMYETALSFLESLPSSHPVLIAVDDADDLFSPTHRARFEALAATRPFALVTARRSFTSSVAARAATRLIFPPAVAEDAVFYGVKPARFAGMKNPGRGLLTGPSFSPSDGVDAQLSTQVPFSDQPVPDLGNGIELGACPLGNRVLWDPATGPVLNVLGPDHMTEPLLKTLGAHLPQGSAVVPRAHETEWEFGELTVVASPIDHVPGYTSPLMQARNRGPLLIVGARSPQELNQVVRDVPYIPPNENCAWFVHGNVRLPVLVNASSVKHSH